MADRYSNPFQGIDISIPVEYHDSVTRYTQRESGAIVDQSPFPRMVDMWFLAVCVAARKGLAPLDIGKYETRKIIEGSIFSSDPWRINALMLVAMAYAKSVDIVAEPRKMMAIANGLAIAGMPIVIEMVHEGKGDPIWNLSEAVEKMVEPLIDASRSV